MYHRAFFPVLPFGGYRRLNRLHGKSCAVFNINNSHATNFDPTLHSLSRSTVKISNIRCFLAAFRKIRRVIRQDQFIGTIGTYKFNVESNSVKRLLHLITVGLFVKAPVSGHVDEVVFTAESHIKDQKMLDKFLSGFGNSVNLCYYCIDEAFSLVEKKHHCFEFSTTTKQMLFSFAFSPLYVFLPTGHC